MFKYVLIGLLVCSALATFSVDLERQQFNEQTYHIKTNKRQVSNGQGGWYWQTYYTSEANALIENADSVFTFKTKVGEEEQNVMIDTTVSENWQYQASATPDINGKGTIEAGSGRAVLTKTEPVTTELRLHNQELKEVKFQKSNKVNVDGTKFLFDAAQYGLALDRRNRENFFEDLHNNKVKLESNGQGFSMYISEKINQLFFGIPQKFFTTQKLESIDAKSQNNNNQWVLPIKNDGITLKNANPIKQQANSYATIDTTTRYIWASDALVNAIVAELNTAGLNCQDVNQQYPEGLYTCTGEAQFPELQIQFRTLDAADGENSRVYTIKNYTQKLETGHRLLIRKSAEYDNRNSGYVKRPINKLETNEDLVVLGTVFLENVYTYFNFENHTIQLAQAYEFVPQTIGISYTWRLWFLILGALVTIGTIAAILAILKKVPYSGVPNVRQSQVQPAQQVNSYIPQQSQVRSSPVYYVAQQQQQQPVTYSPQRVVYQQQQGHYHVGQVPQQSSYYVNNQQ